MVGVFCGCRTVTSVDVCRSISNILFVVDLIRCIYCRYSIFCLRKIEVLLNQITSNTSYSTIIIDNSDVNTVVLTISLSNITAGDRSWCKFFPENGSVRQSKSLLIIPVKDRCWGMTFVFRNNTPCMNARVVYESNCITCIKCRKFSSLLITNLSL